MGNVVVPVSHHDVKNTFKLILVRLESIPRNLALAAMQVCFAGSWLYYCAVHRTLSRILPLETVIHPTRGGSNVPDQRCCVLSAVGRVILMIHSAALFAQSIQSLSL